MNRLELLKNNPAHAAGEGRLIAKAATIGTPSIDYNQRLVKGTVSTCAVDEDNEVVLCHLLSLDYFPGSVGTVYLDHDYTRYPLGVGVCRSLAVRGESLFASTYVSPGAIGDDLLTAIEIGALRHFSIGARATDYGPPTAAELLKYGQHNCIFRAGPLIEYSFTAMPANKTALIEAVSKSLIRRESAVAFGLDDSPVRKSFPVSGPAKIERPALMVEVDGEWVPVFHP